MPPPYSTSMRSMVSRRAPLAYDPLRDPYDPRYRATVEEPLPIVSDYRPPTPNDATPQIDTRAADPPTSNPWTDPRGMWTDEGWDGESLVTNPRQTSQRTVVDTTDDYAVPRVRVDDPPVTTTDPPPTTTTPPPATTPNYATLPLPAGTMPGTGWDPAKWGSERTVKYVAASILSRYQDANGFIDIPAAMQDPEWKQWFPNARFVEGGASDSIDFGDTLSDFTGGTPVGIVDVGWEFDPVKKTGRGLTWLPRNASTAARTTAPPPPTAPTTPGPEAPAEEGDGSRRSPNVTMNAFAYERLVPMNDLMRWRASRRTV